MKLDLQFIDHPGNRERLVVLPEYQFRLLERAANARMYDLEHVNGIAMLPRAEQERVLAGENPIRVVREWRGLKGQQLADLAGISSSMLSQIETTGKTGSAKTFRTIAMVLGVPLELIFPKASDDGLE